LKNASIDGMSVGNIFLYPMTGTALEANQFKSLISKALSTGKLSDIPITKSTLVVLRDQTFTLSELTQNPVPAAENTRFLIGRIKILAVRPGKETSLEYGMKE
jgi:hypothetical protein